MPSVTTEAIVLRRVDYRENDRLLTLLTPKYGRVDAVARGCRRAKSPLAACAEQFALGEYVLFSGKGRHTVMSAQMQETFYPLRQDYDRLRFATYMALLAEAAAQPALRAEGLFTLLARALSYLSYTDKDHRAVTSAFVLHFCRVCGFAPELARCARCGKPLGDGDGDAQRDSSRRAFVSSLEGGALCGDCREIVSDAYPLSGAQMDWLRGAQSVGMDKSGCPDADAPLEWLESYADVRLDRRVMKGRAPR